MWESILRELQNYKWDWVVGACALFGAAMGLVTIALMWQQNRILKRQNEIMASQTTSPTTSMMPSRKLSAIYFLSPLVTIFVAVIAWSGVLYNEGKPRSTLLVLSILLLAIALVLAVPFFIVVRRLISPRGPTAVRPQTAFEKLIEKHGKWSFKAIWGYGTKWVNATVSGQSLTEHVVYLICIGEQSQPLPAKHTVLQVPLMEPVEKQLRLIYPSEEYIVINETNGVISLDPNSPVFAPDPTTKTIMLSLGNSEVAAPEPVFKSVQEILGQIPRNHIPRDGKWPISNDAVNDALLEKVVGRQARILIEVDDANVEKTGQYMDTPYILARFAEPPITNLRILLRAYFDNPIPELRRSVLARGRHDSVELTGKITRADVNHRTDQGGACLNIDLNNCRFVNR